VIAKSELVARPKAHDVNVVVEIVPKRVARILESSPAVFEVDIELLGPKGPIVCQSVLRACAYGPTSYDIIG
jgi:hypothetical protein